MHQEFSRDECNIQHHLTQSYRFTYIGGERERERARERERERDIYIYIYIYMPAYEEEGGFKCLLNISVPVCGGYSCCGFLLSQNEWPQLILYSNSKTKDFCFGLVQPKPLTIEAPTTHQLVITGEWGAIRVCKSILSHRMDLCALHH